MLLSYRIGVRAAKGGRLWKAQGSPTKTLEVEGQRSTSFEGIKKTLEVEGSFHLRQKANVKYGIL
jgi:hypothetical protein